MAGARLGHKDTCPRKSALSGSNHECLQEYVASGTAISILVFSNAIGRQTGSPTVNRVSEGNP